MADLFPIDKLYRTGVVVWDLKKAVRDYTEVYGIRDWQVYHHTPDRLKNSSFFGRVAEHGYSSAVGQTPGGAVTFELIQPGPGASSFKQFLYGRGEGVHHLLLHAGDKKDLAELRAWLASEGILVSQSGSMDGIVDYDVFDTREALGGYYLKAVATEGGDFEQAIEPDETWNVSDEVTWPARGPMAVPLLHHFGIVVRDVVERAESYARLFGINNWNFGLWHSGAGSLEGAHYRGQAVNHSYFTTLVSPVTNFGFELVQPALGQQHYKDEYLNIVGEGIHHLFTQPPAALKDRQDWESLRDWMDSMGVPLVQGARLGSFMEFFYLDTRDKLCGYVTEAGLTLGQRPFPAAGRSSQPSRTLPPVPEGLNSRDFPVDFSARAPRE